MSDCRSISPKPDDAESAGLVRDRFRDAGCDAIPVTAYKPAGTASRYDAATHTGAPDPLARYYRVAWRAMAANVERADADPGIHSARGAMSMPCSLSACRRNESDMLCHRAGFLGSLVSRFLDSRGSQESTSVLATFERLPIADRPSASCGAYYFELCV